MYGQGGGRGVASLMSASAAGALPDPQRAENDQRPDRGGNDVTQRHGDPVQSRPDSEQAEDQPADQRADEAEDEIAEQAEALTLPGDQRPGEGAADQPDDDPDDDLVERWDELADRGHGRFLTRWPRGCTCATMDLSATKKRNGRPRTGHWTLVQYWMRGGRHHADAEGFCARRPSCLGRKRAVQPIHDHIDIVTRRSTTEAEADGSHPNLRRNAHGLQNRRQP